MHHAFPTLETLIRPRLLVVAARHALIEYDRDKWLPRLVELPDPRSLPSHQWSFERLLVKERQLEAARRHHDVTWHAADHVAVMTALLHEAQACSLEDAMSTSCAS